MQGAALDELAGRVPVRFWIAVGLLAVGLVAGILVRWATRNLLQRMGVPGAIEGTGFDRTARSFGTSTVGILANLAGYFVLGVAVSIAFAVTDIAYVQRLLDALAGFLPQLFLAVLVLIVGIVVGDKVELFIAERFRGVKLPQVSIIPTLAKYSVFYLAALIALGQVNVATGALLILLAAYVFALVFLGGIAFHQLLTSGAAGTYLLLREPYTIGDEIRVGETRGIVQEMDLFVTHVESDGEEFVLPNSKVFSDGVVRIRS
ncbi:MAG: mechanosensitive ion channel domain-containing protein [Haloferacaceae archaeon]